MTVFDEFVISVFNHYKPKYKRKANVIAVFYISVLQSSLILLLGVFFAAFFGQMKVDTMSSSKAWTLFVIASIIIYFINWLGYSGKKRRILNAKQISRKSKNHSIWVLWLLPLACIALALLILKKT